MNFNTNLNLQNNQKNNLNKESEIILKDILKVINSEINNLEKILPEKTLNEPYKYLFEIGGKRVRALLTMLVSGIISGNPENALKPALAIELLHNFTLVHDDIMDNSPTRRGRPTIHTKFDNSIAILLGDIIVGVANEQILATNNFYQTFKEFNKALIEVCRGQALDMEFNINQNVKSSDYFTMIELKTASLIICSLVMGALANDADSKMINDIKQLGYNIGVAFQLQDDLLDLFGKEAAVGKRIGNDIVEGKKTYMMIRAKEIIIEKQLKNTPFEHSSENIITNREEELISNFYQNNGLPIELIEEIQNLITKYGIKQDAESKVELYFNNTFQILERLPQNEYRDILAFIITQLINREV